MTNSSPKRPSTGFFAPLRRWWQRSAAGQILPQQSTPDADTEALDTRLQVTSDGLVRAAAAITSVIEQQASGAEEQVKLIQEAHHRLDDFLLLSEQVDEQARSMTRRAKETADASERGQEAIARAIAGIEDIRTQVEAIARTIITMGDFTRRVDDIIASVSEIATQSNLLALNASIEAARAGAQGRGFAVVAEEVRTLAGQSTRAAAQVRAILAEIQEAIAQAVEKADAGMQRVDTGLTLTQATQLVIEELSSSVLRSQAEVNGIFDAIRDQAGGMEQIAISIERIDRITAQNVASARMFETISTNLTRLAADLQSTVGGDPGGGAAADRAGSMSNG